MNLSTSEILRTAEENGFRPEMVEKVLLMMNLLKTLDSHPYIKGRWVLKGGTALNLFIWKLPRLSLDIDLNYIGALDREKMKEERPIFEDALQAVFSREGFSVKRIPRDHAGGKWRLGFRSYSGRPGNLEVDVNYMYRLPLWDVRRMDSHLFGGHQATNIPVIDSHELAAGKLAALFARGQSRDLFDCQRILVMDDLEQAFLRIAFVVYGGMNRKDWRTISLDDLDFNARELGRQLIPTLHSRSESEHGSEEEFGSRLVQDCKERMDIVLPFSTSEQKFLDTLLDHGKIDPSLLTSDAILQDRIERQPLLLWKAQNVKRHILNSPLTSDPTPS